MTAPLDIVGVEHPFVNLARDHRGQFPCQVGGIPDAGVHALPEEGRLHVGGVAGEEDPAHAEAPGCPGVAEATSPHAT